jgi:hypothetical protein
MAGLDPAIEAAKRGTLTPVESRRLLRRLDGWIKSGQDTEREAVKVVRAIERRRSDPALKFPSNRSRV